MGKELGGGGVGGGDSISHMVRNRSGEDTVSLWMVMGLCK